MTRSIVTLCIVLATLAAIVSPPASAALEDDGGIGPARFTPPANPYAIRFADVLPPVVGLPWTVAVVVDAARAATGARVEFVATSPLHVPGSADTVVTLPLDLAEGEQKEVQATFLLDEAAPAQLMARFLHEDGATRYFPATHASLAPLADGMSLQLGGVPTAARVPGAPPASSEPGETLATVAPTVYRPDERGSGVGSAGTITVTGQVEFWSTRAGDTGFKGIHYAVVEVWDDDDFSGDDLLATVCTDGNGNFNSGALDNNDPEFGTQDIYIKVRTSCTNGVELRDGGGTMYTFRNLDSTEASCVKTVQVNVADGTKNLGVCDDPASQDDWWTIRDFAEYAADLPRGQGSSIGVVQLRVPAGAGNGPDYLSSVIRIPDATYRDGPDVLSHEHGHFMMDKLYTGGIPAHTCPDPHYVNGDSNTGCAWTEGWPDYTAVQSFVSTNRWQDTTGVYNDPGFSHNYETNGLSGGGDDNEGAVAGTLWDLVDDADDGIDTVDTYTFSNVYSAFTSGQPDSTFSDYRGSFSTTTAKTKDFNRVAWQNSIDYDTSLTVTTHTAPTGGGWLRGTITVSASATDSDTDIKEVQFYWSSDSSCTTGDSFITADTTSAYSTSWNTANAGDRNTLYFCERGISIVNNKAGSFASSVSFGIDNTAPTGSVTAPSTGGPLAYTVSWTSSDSRSGVSGVTLQEQPPAGSFTSVCSGGASSSCSRNPASVGTYCYRAIVTDNAGNTFTTAQSCTLNLG